ELCFGTVDSYLLFRLTGGAVHATDAANASRTMLFDIGAQDWDPELRDLFGRAIPIAGMAGDQQAALVGQGCFAPGTIKSTYGTGCFALMNIGGEARASQHRLLTTVGYRLRGKTTYALEGSIFVAGAAIQWLRDGLRVLDSAASSEAAAASRQPSGLYLVPAFT